MYKAKMWFYYFNTYYLLVESEDEINRRDDSDSDYISQYIANLCEDFDWDVDAELMAKIINEVNKNSQIDIKQISESDFKKLKLEEFYFVIDEN
ncbi:MAG: hypothetical protein ACM3KI_11035 [Bacillota bacterium]